MRIPSALSAVMTLTAMLALAACQTEAEATGTPPSPVAETQAPTAPKPIPTGPPKPDPVARAACKAQGGSYAAAGRLGLYQCVLPQPDAGQACRTENDCTGFCLAETKQCSAQTPIFGCFDLLDADGRQQTICID